MAGISQSAMKDFRCFLLIKFARDPEFVGFYLILLRNLAT